MSPAIFKKYFRELSQLELYKNGPLVEATVSVSERVAKIRDSKPKENIIALIDTGASISSISERLASKLKLNAVGKVGCVGVQGDKKKRNLYIVDFTFTGVDNNGFLFTNLRVIGIDLKESICDMLIGRDILKISNLKYEGVDGKIELEFPSPTHLTIEMRSLPKKSDE